MKLDEAYDVLWGCIPQVLSGLEVYILSGGSLTEEEKHEASMALGWLERTFHGVDRNSRLHGRFHGALSEEEAAAWELVRRAGEWGDGDRSSGLEGRDA